MSHALPRKLWAPVQFLKKLWAPPSPLWWAVSSVPSLSFTRGKMNSFLLFYRIFERLFPSVCVLFPFHLDICELPQRAIMNPFFFLQYFWTLLLSSPYVCELFPFHLDICELPQRAITINSRSIYVWCAGRWIIMLFEWQEFKFYTYKFGEFDVLDEITCFNASSSTAEQIPPN